MAVDVLCHIPGVRKWFISFLCSGLSLVSCMNCYLVTKDLVDRGRKSPVVWFICRYQVGVLLIFVGRDCY